MASVNVDVVAGQWVQLPNDLSLTVQHRTGDTIIYVASETEPSLFNSETPIFGQTRAGSGSYVGGYTLPVWATCIAGSAVLSYTEKADSSSSVVKYDELQMSGLSTFNTTLSQLYTALGKRYSHKFDLTFSSGETKYFLYRSGSVSSQFIFAVEERIFRAQNGAAELEVLGGASGYTATTAMTNIQKANNVKDNSSEVLIYNLTDGDSNTEPTADGLILDTDFVASSGSGSNSTGGFSPQTGMRIYSPGLDLVLKVTNDENSSNRISLEYSWLELPSDYLSD